MSGVGRRAHTGASGDGGVGEEEREYYGLYILGPESGTIRKGVALLE